MNTDQIYKTLNILRSKAERLDYEYGKSHYQWELGLDVYSAIMESLVATINYYGYKETIGGELMGVPVIKEPNYEEPNMIRLWREVSL